ncbi:MAG: iron ABC transporter permease [bacterium]|nr:iron ABC transporter permease [Muribaculaceae bacterium]MDD5818125.1 iron ABC transporter permease [bacterium]
MKNSSSSRYACSVMVLALLLVVLAAACLIFGSVDIDVASVVRIAIGQDSDNEAWNIIVRQTRIPMVITAALAGSALAIAGLLLQTTFNNPLAGPSILGVSTGAGLGVAVVMLAMGGSIGKMLGDVEVGGYVATLGGAFLGAAAVMALLIVFSSIVKSNTMLLIIGMLVSYLGSSVVQLLNSIASEESIHSYVTWGFGTFSGVTTAQLPLYVALIAFGLLCSVLMVKPLNALLLGTRYAENLGVNTRHTRIALLMVTGLLTAVVTAYCGPIGFLGLVVPHISRLMLSTSNHSRLLPVTILAGADMALLCTLVSVGGDHGVIPINAITPVIGVPIIIYIIINRRKIQYFN